MANSDRQKVKMQLQSAGEDRLLPLVYDEFRRLAASQMVKETPGPTLQKLAAITND